MTFSRPLQRAASYPQRSPAVEQIRIVVGPGQTGESTMQAPPLTTFARDLFAGQVALVTGGGRGIGRAIALAFAALGADVVIASRNMDNLAATAREIEALGRRCLAFPTNVRDTAQVDALVAAVLERFGRIDTLINNAGGQFPARPFDISDNGWRSVVDLNLNGTWNVTQRVARHMVERGSGSIVSIVHIYSFERGAPPFVHSGAARAGVVSMTRSLAYYLARKGVTINALAPGTIATAGVREEEFAYADRPDYESQALRDIPAHRLGEADEVAAICAFLCSPAARYINGADLIADGGYSLDTWTPMFDPEV
jgi:NAD(P)-dependent dehydrogenase (short-subunit alcohol dehydrogenase family)